MEPSQLPDGVPIVVDPGVQLDLEHRSIVGGTPLRVLRLSARGVDIVRRLRDGESVPRSPAVGRLLRTLTDAGMADPVPAARAPRSEVDWVVPIHDGREPIDANLPEGTLVVHDAGPNVEVLTERCAQHGWVLHRRAQNGGPGAARMSGAALGESPIVIFVDAGVRLAPDTVERLLGHFDDPAVGAVAPRILSEEDPSIIGRYEHRRSPLDLGPVASIVHPAAKVSYVPSAVLAVRRTALEGIGGFDESLRFGEDVDLVWRLHDAGWRIRYEPAATATHAPRSSLGALWRQRRGYGSAAAPLHRRHPGAVAPVRLNVWSAATWALLALGRGRIRLLGAAVGAGSTAALVRQLDGLVGDPLTTGGRLGGLGTLMSGRWLAHAVARAWLPFAVAGAVVMRRPGPLLLALLGPPLAEWVEERPDIDPLTWIALRLGDDAAYCAGVWTGMAAEGSLGAIRPAFTGIPGVGDD